MQDPNCAQYPSKLTSRACPSPGGNQCFSKVYGANTIRGCKATLDLEICEGEECNLCTGNSCNNKVYPGNRLTCYHCEDNKDCAEEQKDATKNYPCLAYKKEDACVWITTDGSVTRKCLSDVEKCDFPDCNSCKGNGCNKNNSSLLQINTILLTIFFVISCSAFKSF